MRKIRELLRLRWEQRLPQRVIGNSLRLSQGSVSKYLNRARRAGLTWPLPDELDDARLEALLFPPPPNVPSDQRPVPDWAAVPTPMTSSRPCSPAVASTPKRRGGSLWRRCCNSWRAYPTDRPRMPYADGSTGNTHWVCR